MQHDYDENYPRYTKKASNITLVCNIKPHFFAARSSDPQLQHPFLSPPSRYVCNILVHKPWQRQRPNEIIILEKPSLV